MNAATTDLRAPAALTPPAASGSVTLSVLVPAFNAADTIADALESAVRQDPAPHEIIVSDDGSTDDLTSALAPYASSIRVITDVNRGLATARNRAAAVATGTHLALLDADDIWLPGRARAFVDAATARPDLDIITTDAYIVRDGRRDVASYYGTREWPEGSQIEAILRSNFVFGAAAIRRTAFERVGGYDGRLRFAEDWDLFIRLLLSGSTAGLVARPLYEYRRRDDSLTGQRLLLAVGVLEVLERLETSPLSRTEQTILRSTIATWRARAARAAVAGRSFRSIGLAASMLRDPKAVVGQARGLIASERPIRLLKRLARPVRDGLRHALDVSDPARLVLPAGRHRDGRTSSIGFVCVYRSNNAGIVRRLIDGIGDGATVKLWALDSVDPDLAANTTGCGPGTRFELLNRLVADVPEADRSDGLVIADDDVRFVVGDVGGLVAVGAALEMDLYQPAHVTNSFASLSTVDLVRKRRLTAARRTGYVEQGPIIVLSAGAQRLLLPLPEDMGMGWGVEVRWAAYARRSELRLGVVDAVSIRHLVPPAGGYDTAPEQRRLAAELAAVGVQRVADLQVVTERVGLRNGGRAVRLGRE